MTNHKGHHEILKYVVFIVVRHVRCAPKLIDKNELPRITEKT